MNRLFALALLLLTSCAAQQQLMPARQPPWPYALPPVPVDSLTPRVVAMPDSLPILPWLLERARRAPR